MDTAQIILLAMLGVILLPFVLVVGFWIWSWIITGIVYLIWLPMDALHRRLAPRAEDFTTTQKGGE